VLEQDAPSTRAGTSAATPESATAAGWALAVLTLLALGLRLTSLSRSLFNDETFSLALSQRGFGHMISLAGYEANGMAYSILLWPVTRIFGTGIEVLRLPAVVIGTASVPLMYWAARAFARRRGVALLAATLVAVNPMAIWYSQVARSYALVVLGACLAFGALSRALEQPGRRSMWVLYVVGMLLMGYSNLLAPAMVLPAQALMLWTAADGVGRTERRRELARRWSYALAAALVLSIPLLIAAAIERGRRDPLYWLPKLSRGLVEVAVQEFGGGFSGVKAVGWLTLIVGVALVGAAAVGGRSRARADGAPAAGAEASGRRGLAVAAAWGALPPALLLAISAAIPVFWPRYAIVALPGLCLLLALAVGVLVDRPGQRWLAAAGVGLLLCLGVYADAKQVDAVQQEWKPLAGWLRAARQPGEPVIVDSVLMLPSIGYYDPSLRSRDGRLVVKEWNDTALPPGVIGFKDPTGYGSIQDGPPPPALVQRLARSGTGTVWLVVGETSGRAFEFPAVRWAGAHCRVAAMSRTRIEVLRVSSCR
jgi:hypothetical protein